MRILVLCKRQYTGRDLLDDRYGRLHALPAGLAARGHQVTVVASSYRRRGAVERTEDGVAWRGIDVLPNPLAVGTAWATTCRTLRPDVVISSSDALHLVLGERLARRLQCPAVLDMYDDYEAFGLSRLPGLRVAMRKACGQADAVLSVSGALASMLSQRGVDERHIHILANGVPADFSPKVSKAGARSRLGLPADALLVGTAGALDMSRGIHDLLQAVKLAQAQKTDVRLVVAGPHHAGISSSYPPGTIDLGHLPHQDVAILFRALDVGVVCNRDGPFARACHPMKLAEMVVVGTPVVAADLGEVARLLSSRPDARYSPGDPVMLAARILAQLDAPRPLDRCLAKEWPVLAVDLEDILCEVVERYKRNAPAVRKRYV